MADGTQAIVGATGPVKWFDTRRGYGFIVGPNGEDIFVHFSAIQTDGFRTLNDGVTVNYDAIKTDKGWKATRVARTDVLEVRIPGQRGRARSPRR